MIILLNLIDIFLGGGGTRIRTPAESRPFASIPAFLFEAASEEIVRFQEE